MGNLNTPKAIATRNRRKNQICKTYTVKVDYSHLSKNQLNYLNMLFIEAKWLYNAQLSSSNIFTFDYKTKEIQILDKDKQLVKREIKYLSSQMKQALVFRTRDNIVNLSKSKKHGNSVGRLKFKSIINSIPLTQYDTTYKIKSSKYIHIQKFKKDFKVMGLNQIPQEVEFANATLIRRNNNFYLKVTCFLPKTDKVLTGKSIGLDFGIKDSVVDSNGNKYSFQFPETRQLKKASRQMNKKKLGSKNRYKAKLRLNKQYDKISNRKQDTIHKFIHKLTTENDHICVQDESLKSWHSSKLCGFGRKVQYSIMGGIISGLKQKPETSIVSKRFPSTQLCSMCGCLNKISLSERVYHCNCGYTEDRDTHSAVNILIQGLKQIGVEYIYTMPVEDKTSNLHISSSVSQVCSMKQEAISVREG